MLWSTKGREPLLTEVVEPFVHRMLGVRCNELGGQSFAINGMPDHVHLVATIPVTMAVATFIGRLKGSTSRFTHLEFNSPFEWQDGYGVFTLSKRNLQQAIDYVERQKEHHRAGTIVPALECVSDDDDGPSRRLARSP